MPSVRDRSAGRLDVGQRVTKLKQGRDALIRDRRVGQKDVRQRMPMMTCGYAVLIRDRRFGHPGGTGQRAPMLSHGCGALIRALCVGQRDAGQRVKLLNQCRDGHNCLRSVGQQPVGQ